LPKRTTKVSGVLAAAEAYASTLPHREGQLRLVRSLGRKLLDAYDEWIEKVERARISASQPAAVIV
jgi:hypothetical protein